MTTTTITDWKPFHKHPHSLKIASGLYDIPDHWALTPVQGKRPYRPSWQSEAPLSQEQISQSINQGEQIWSEKKERYWHGYASGYGLRLGDISGGLIALDIDGASVNQLVNAIAQGNFPNTPMWSSGKEGRYQALFQVPDQYRDALKDFHRQNFTTWNGFHCQAGEQLEIRYNNHQSVLPYSFHPETGKYEWLISPADADVAEAPAWLLRLAVGELKDPQLSPPARAIPNTKTDEDWAREYLEALSPYRADDYADWIKVGQCLHSVSDALLSDWDSWSSRSSKYQAGECEKKWRSFKPNNGLTIATLGLMAKDDGWQPSRSPSPYRLDSPQSASNNLKADDDEEEKPTKLNPKQLIRYIRENLNLRYNELTREIEIDGKELDCEPYLYLLDEHNIDCGKDKAVDMVMRVAKEHSYNPVKEYLQKVSKAVTPIDISDLSTRYLGTDEAIYDIFVFKTLVSAVARAFNPGCKVDTALVLQGSQGMQKSTFLNILGGQWFDDSMGNGTDKDDLLLLHGSWIQEWGELDYIFGKKHVGEIKRFMAKKKDSFREPYARKPQTYKRHSIIVGSTNETQFLNDPTGSRRFWVIPVAKKKIDCKTLQQERDQIWAAAVEAYQAGCSWWLTEDEETSSSKNNEQFNLSDEWESAIAEFLEDRSEVVINEVLTEVFSYQPKDMSRRDQMRVSNCLKALGWSRGNRRLYNGKRQIVWEKVDPQGMAGMALNPTPPTENGSEGAPHLRSTPPEGMEGMDQETKSEPTKKDQPKESTIPATPQKGMDRGMSSSEKTAEREVQESTIPATPSTPTFSNSEQGKKKPWGTSTDLPPDQLDLAVIDYLTQNGEQTEHQIVCDLHQKTPEVRAALARVAISTGGSHWETRWTLKT